MNMLTDLIPARWRRLAYGILALAGLILTTWTAAGRTLPPFLEAIGGLITAGVAALAHANTTTPPADPPSSSGTP